MGIFLYYKSKKYLFLSFFIFCILFLGITSVKASTDNLFFSDNFDALNNGDINGQNGWSSGGGATWNVEAGGDVKVVHGNGGVFYLNYIANGTSTTKNQRLKVDYNIESSISYVPQFWLRRTSLTGDGGGYLIFYEGDYWRIAVHTVNMGYDYTELANVTTSTISVGVWYTAEVEIVDNGSGNPVIKVYNYLKNNTRPASPILTYTDTAKYFSSGYMGFGTNDMHVSYDNVRMYHDTDTDITAFNFASPSTTGVINTSTHTISLTVPYGTNVTNLTPTISLPTGATVSPLSGVAQNFTNPVIYTVTAEDATTTQNYTVTVTVAPNTDTDITAFNFASPSTTGVINTSTHTISLTVPYGTNVTNLTPTIILPHGATISPLSGVAQNFTNPVIYTVTAEDATTTQNYTVTVSVAQNTATDITSFNFSSPATTGVVNTSTHTVALTVPYGTTVTNLTPTITLSSGATISPLSGVSQNFTSPVTYIVTAQNAVTTQEYVVTVTVSPNTATDITSFNFSSPATTGIVNNSNHTVSLTVPYGTNVTNLTPTISLSAGATISPLSGTAQNFTNPVAYIVTAEDAVTTQNYTVTVTVEEASSTVSTIPSSTSSSGSSLPVAAYLPPSPPLFGSDFSVSAISIPTVNIVKGIAANFGRANIKLILITGTDTVKMAISNNPDFKGSVIEPYQKEKEWNVCWKSSVLQYPSECEEKKHTVYVKYYTIWGRPSKVVTVEVDGSSSAISSGYIFKNDLQYGMRNAEIKELQKRLKAEGFFDYYTFTEYFGLVTQNAVKKYQASRGISPVNGRVGPLTRGELNK